jgi:hypothetical protein
MARSSHRQPVMYYGAANPAPRSAGGPAFRFNWRFLGLAGGLMLLLALWMNPGSAKPARWEEPTRQPSTPLARAAAADLPTAVKDEPAKPEHLSVLDVVGKVSLVILVLYGIGFGLMKARNLGLLTTLGAPAPQALGQRLAVRETLPLGRQDGTLYLVELDGQLMLLGAAADQLQVLWSSASERATTFTPLDQTPEPRQPERKPTLVAQDDLPLFQRGFAKPARKEADWARERSRLISALAQTTE